MILVTVTRSDPRTSRRRVDHTPPRLSWLIISDPEEESAHKTSLATYEMTRLGQTLQPEEEANSVILPQEGPSEDQPKGSEEANSANQPSHLNSDRSSGSEEASTTIFPLAHTNGSTRKERWEESRLSFRCGKDEMKYNKEIRTIFGGPMAGNFSAKARKEYAKVSS
ncbi:hypothetical protein NE237_015120 [Protea cynaroides]|uniref:Uncharacterized protein n=1 Tax=Protea cynaroides TaxID=273540 RepID=A0A9Q0KDG0_9MAGN|nr:hypothetical protein NE237_015120 [Protea cynaroides]